MQARVVSAARGPRWLAEGWRIFRAAPFGWIVAVLGYWLAMSVLSIVPLVGVAAAAVLVPAFSVGFMALARASGRGAPLDTRLLFEGFRQRQLIGVVQLLAVLLHMEDVHGLVVLRRNHDHLDLAVKGRQRTADSVQESRCVSRHDLEHCVPV